MKKKLTAQQFSTSLKKAEIFFSNSVCMEDSTQKFSKEKNLRENATRCHVAAKNLAGRGPCTNALFCLEENVSEKKDQRVSSSKI